MITCHWQTISPCPMNCPISHFTQFYSLLGAILIHLPPIIGFQTEWKTWHRKIIVDQSKMKTSNLILGLSHNYHSPLIYTLLSRTSESLSLLLSSKSSSLHTYRRYHQMKNQNLLFSISEWNLNYLNFPRLIKIGYWNRKDLSYH